MNRGLADPDSEGNGNPSAQRRAFLDAGMRCEVVSNSDVPVVASARYRHQREQHKPEASAP